MITIGSVERIEEKMSKVKILHQINKGANGGLK